MEKLLLSILVSALLVACGDSNELARDQVASEGTAGEAGAEIAAAVPDTEIYLADLSWQTDGPQMGVPVNISQRPGYDNQPRFMPDGKSLVYSSIRDGKQSDVYRYLIKEKQTVPFVLSSESEYSPTPMPNDAGVSVVRVEADGTQRLWYFPAANSSAQLLFPDVKGVGYHAWLGVDQAAMFIVEDPSVLLIANQSTGEQKRVASGIGRALARIPGEEALAFVDKQMESAWQIARYDLEDESLAELIATPDDSEDFAWSPDGGVFMGDGLVLRYWDGDAESDWQAVDDLSGQFAGRITRLDVAPDAGQLVFVIAPLAEE